MATWRVIAVVFLVALTGCSDSNEGPSPECKSTADCSDLEVCNDQKCEAIDPCKDSADPKCVPGECGDCGANATCDGTVCVCDPGFTKSGGGCVAVDECAEGTAGCSPDASCTNTPNGATCACLPGFVGDGKTCEVSQDDECTKGTDNCHEDATCTDTADGFTCACNTGYDGDGVSCEVLSTDECTLQTDNCHENATCTDTADGFTCTCNGGFIGDGVTCQPTPAGFPPEVEINSVVWDTYVAPTSEPAGYLIPFVDALSGLRVTRVGDQAAFGVTNQQVQHNYSSDSAWNSDGTKIKLSGYPAAILDGETYELLYFRDIPSYGRWSNTDPNRIYGSPGNTFAYTDISTQAYVVMHTFSDYVKIDLGYGEGNISQDDKYVALIADSPGVRDIVVYDIANDAVLATLGIGTADDLDWVSMSPSGNYVVVAWRDDGAGPNQGTDIYDRDLTNRRDLSEYSGHSDMGWDQAGNEVQVSIGDQDTWATDHYIRMSRLSDGVTTHLFYDTGTKKGIWGAHVSMRAINRPGWAYISEGCCATNNVVGNEVFALKLDDGSSNVIERWGQHHTDRLVGYGHEAKASVSRDGTKVMFSSNFNDPILRGWAAAPSYIIDLKPMP